MENTCAKLLVALIVSYKRSTHAKKKGELSPNEKNRKRIKEKQNLRERLRAAPEEKKQRSIENQSFLFFSCFFLVFLFIHRDILDG